MKTIISFLCAFIAYNVSAFAQSGILDSSFNKIGYNVVTCPRVGSYLGNNIITTQSNGKIIVATNYSTGVSNYLANCYFALIRFNTDGTLDNTFGNRGLDTISMSTKYGVSYSLAIQSDGKIVIAGTTDAYLDGGQLRLARFDSTGILDTTFGQGGYDSINIGLTASATCLSINPNGKILAAGFGIYSSGLIGGILIQCNSDGSIDTTFGKNGIDTLVGYRIYSVITQLNGKIILGGFAGNSVYEFAMARFNTDGSLDSSFGTNGKVLTNIGNSAFGGPIAIQNDNKILLGGYSNPSNINSPTCFAIARYDTDGVLDESFGINGIDTTSFEDQNSEANSIVVQPDGKIIMAGTEGNNPFINFALLRYDSSGKIDNTFGIDGKAVTNITDTTSQALSAILQSDGKLLVAGNSNSYLHNYIVVARYTTGITAGILDFSKQNNSVLVYPNPIHDNAVLNYTLTSNENITINLYNTI